MKEIKVVVGANYGDEGKGLVTDYFAHQASVNNKSSLVVLHNGGPQHGHTVVTPEGYRHVFKHIGAGTFAGSDTFLAENFLINPMELRREMEEFDKNFPQYTNYKVFISPKCRLITHMDMMANQIREEYRGKNNYATCGMGIWETVLRCLNSGKRPPNQINIMMKDIMNVNPGIRLALKNIREYYLYDRLYDIPKSKIAEEWQTLFYDSNMDEHYIQDFFWMINEQRIQVLLDSEAELFSRYDTIIFETGQGLMIDGKLKEGEKFNTPSNADSLNPLRMVQQCMTSIYHDIPIEVCYVTRPYLTRHGKGELYDECSIYDIPSEIDIVDNTNITNQFQGSLRYGILDYEKLNLRIWRDFYKWSRFKGIIPPKSTLFITHRNEYRKHLPRKATAICDGMYISDGMTRDSVIKGINRE